MSRHLEVAVFGDAVDTVIYSVEVLWGKSWVVMV